MRNCKTEWRLHLARTCCRKGRTSEIYLPCSEKPATVTGESETAKQTPGGNETILVVKDETSVRELASEFLGVSGYKIFEAKEGAEHGDCRLSRGGDSPALPTWSCRE